MKALGILFLFISPLAGAIIEIKPATVPCVFAGRKSSIELVCLNRTGTNVVLDLDYQLFQASSATAAPWSRNIPWRQLRLNVHQKTLESFEIALPSLREESTFVARISHLGTVVTTFKIHAWPETLVSTLTNTIRRVEVHRVDSEMRELLERSGIHPVDLDTDRTNSGNPDLTIYGPPSTREDYLRTVAAVKAGRNVLWIYSEEGIRHLTAPSYSVARIGKGTIVTAKRSTFDRILDDPLSQLRFIRVIQLATGGESNHCPEFEL